MPIQTLTFTPLVDQDHVSSIKADITQVEQNGAGRLHTGANSGDAHVQVNMCGEQEPRDTQPGRSTYTVGS